MKFETLNSWKDVLREARMWLDLERRATDISPFQTWGWTHAWIRHFGQENEQCHPFVIVARDRDGSPLALLPLQLDRHVGMRRITWLTMPALQYGGLLATPMTRERLAAVLDGFLEILHLQSADFVSLPLLPPALLEKFGAACSTFQVVDHTATFRVNLSAFENWRAFELQLKPSARRARKKRLNRLKREGNVSLVVHPAGSVPEELLVRALAWKSAWLEERGLADSLPNHPAFRGFLHALLAHPGQEDERGRWLAAALLLDERPLALDVGMALDGVFHAWFSAYDPAYSRFSPGKVALWLMLQWCMENGLQVYDMLANPAPYKIDWANEKQPLGVMVKSLSAGGLAYVVWKTRAEILARQAYGILPAALKTAMRRPLARLRGGMRR